MPDKQNESKFMAMLERRGIVRKTGSEAEFMEVDSDGASEHERVNADLRSMFNSPIGDSVKTTPAARQPVPGMFSPDTTPERFQQSERGQAKHSTHVGSDMSMHTSQTEYGQSQFTGRSEPEHPRRFESPKPTSFFNGTDYKDGISMDEQHVTSPGTQFAPIPSVSQSTPFTYSAPFTPTAFEKISEPPPVENYTERYLDIDELYEALSLKSKRTDTVYLIEEYLKTLPESLPDESRREIVNKIIAASGFDSDLLIGDGVLRVKMLKEYAERFAKYTDDFVSARNTEVDELEQQIMRIRRMIENRRDLHKKQFFAIEAEAQRLKDILTFISG